LIVSKNGAAARYLAASPGEREERGKVGNRLHARQIDCLSSPAGAQVDTTSKVCTTGNLFMMRGMGKLVLPRLTAAVIVLAFVLNVSLPRAYG
jgi:hypothetical protein